MTIALLTVGLLTRDQLASELGIQPSTLADWENDGMPVIKVRRNSFYDLRAVAAWMRKESKRRQE